jgi:hypothetical protein
MALFLRGLQDLADRSNYFSFLEIESKTADTFVGGGGVIAVKVGFQHCHEHCNLSVIL